jgi:hypothetical protein
MQAGSRQASSCGASTSGRGSGAAAGPTSGRRALLLGGGAAAAGALAPPPLPALAKRKPAVEDAPAARGLALPAVPRVKLAPGLEVSRVRGRGRRQAGSAGARAGGSGASCLHSSLRAGRRPPVPPRPTPTPLPQVIKGGWQLDGKHRGDTVTDRTSGGPAIEDMERYVRAGGWRGG